MRRRQVSAHPLMRRDMDSSISSLQQIEERAAAWILRRESAQWAAADDDALAAWLAESMSHRVAYLRLGSTWREAGRLKGVSAGLPAGEVPPRGAIAASPFFSLKQRNLPEAVAASERSHRFARPTWYRGIAAAVVAMAVFGGSLSWWLSRAPSYETPIGGLATVPVGEGSRIILNTNTKLTLDVTATERGVNLQQGEAFFEVAKDPSRPFVVHAKGKRVVAVGTRFSVRVKDEGVLVVVTEGKVRVDDAAPLLKLPASSDGGAGAVVEHEDQPLLLPGAVALASEHGLSLEQHSVADVEQTLRWRTGFVVLRKTRLADAVAEFNRYNSRQLVIDDPSLGDIMVGGNFQSNNIDGFVRLLQQGFGVRARARGEEIVLSR